MAVTSPVQLWQSVRGANFDRSDKLDGHSQHWRCHAAILVLRTGFLTYLLPSELPSHSFGFIAYPNGCPEELLEKGDPSRVKINNEFAHILLTMRMTKLPTPSGVLQPSTT